jgi:hypothetical protein
MPRRAHASSSSGRRAPADMPRAAPIVGCPSPEIPPLADTIIWAPAGVAIPRHDMSSMAPSTRLRGHARTRAHTPVAGVATRAERLTNSDVHTSTSTTVQLRSVVRRRSVSSRRHVFISIARAIVNRSTSKWAEPTPLVCRRAIRRSVTSLCSRSRSPGLYMGGRTAASHPCCLAGLGSCTGELRRRMRAAPIGRPYRFHATGTRGSGR